jgi:hypothetical protein
VFAKAADRTGDERSKKLGTKEKRVLVLFY